MFATEQHYSPKQVAKMWALSDRTILRIFKDEPGVLLLGKGESTRNTRRYQRMSIPTSVLERVKEKLSK